MSRDTCEAGAMSRGMCMIALRCAGSQAAKEEKCQTVVCVHCPIYTAFKELARWSKKQKRVCNNLKLTPGKRSATATTSSSTWWCACTDTPPWGTDLTPSHCMGAWLAHLTTRDRNDGLGGKRRRESQAHDCDITSFVGRANTRRRARTRWHHVQGEQMG